MLDNYRQFVKTTAVYPWANTGSLSELMYLSLGLSSEAGEVAGLIKKIYRDSPDMGPVLEKLKLELGDVLWYLVMLMEALEFPTEDIVQLNVDKLGRRQLHDTLHGSGDYR